MKPSLDCHSFGVCSLGIASCLFLFSPLLAQEEGTPQPAVQQQPADPDEQSTTSAPDSDRALAEKKRSKEKLEKATKAMGAVVGIAVLGIATIAGVMIGAKRLRRIARDPGSNQTTIGNDFWFIKPPKPHPTDDEHMETHRPTHTPPETDTRE